MSWPAECHHCNAAGLSVRAFQESQALQDFFNVVSVTEDRDGAFYASTMEARKARTCQELLMECVEHLPVC